jgi:3D (Asp-Asp-Asp) domain-containing protein
VWCPISPFKNGGIARVTNEIVYKFDVTILKGIQTMVKLLTMMLLLFNLTNIELETTTVMAKVTGYAPLDNVSGICADENPTVTSVGHHPSSKYAAADPKKIPYGTLVDVPGYGRVEIGDTGGAMRNYDGYQIDLFFDTYEEAIQWGVQYIEIVIIERG